MRASDEQIMERVTVLLSTLPMRNTDNLGIKAALTAYSEALDGCDIRDLRAVVEAIFGTGSRKWAPSAPELAQAVRDQAARRENASKALEYSPNYSQKPERDPPTADEHARMQEKWMAVRKEFGHRYTPEEFLQAAKADGRLTEKAE